MAMISATIDCEGEGSLCLEVSASGDDDIAIITIAGNAVTLPLDEFLNFVGFMSKASKAVKKLI